MYTLIAAAAEHESGDKISPILAPYPGLMFWTAVAFFLSLWVLKKFAFGPMQAALDKRRDTVNGALDNAEKLRAESEQTLAQYKQQLADARAEADQMRDRARKDADEHVAHVKREIETTRQEQLGQTKQQIRAEVDKAMGDLRGALAELTVQASEKVLRGSLDATKHEQLIQQSVDELDLGKLQRVGAGS